MAGWEYNNESCEDDGMTRWNIRSCRCLLINQRSFIFYNCLLFDPLAHRLVSLSSFIERIFGNINLLFPCSHTRIQPLKQTAIPTHRSIVTCKYRRTDTQAHWLMGNIVTEQKQKCRKINMTATVHHSGTNKLDSEP